MNLRPAGLFRHRRATAQPPALPPQVPRHGPGARRLRPALLAALGGLLGLSCVAALVLRLLLAPAPGEWSMPLAAGPWQWQVGVPSLLRLATAPWVGPRLEGMRLATRWGPVRLGWQSGTRTLQLHCAPCSLQLPALGPQPLQVGWLHLSVRRDFEALEGTLIAGNRGGTQNAPVLQVHFHGRLRQEGLSLQLEALPAPIADWYAVLAPELPELRRATIEGRFSWKARMAWPTGEFALTPVVEGFAVDGLGTGTLAHAASSCGPPGRLRMGDWLSRSVIAAEDQRFFEHPGYDLQQLRSALAGNQRAGPLRGASTLTQQLAKRLATGDARNATRKMRELLYAVEMEQTLGKARILQLYLDNAPWGADGLCGAEAAAQHYFGRPARRLDTAQAVWLAAMLHNPQAEALAWNRAGTINLARASWVAQGMGDRAGMGVQARGALLRTLQALPLPSQRRDGPLPAGAVNPARPGTRPPPLPANP